MSPGKADTMLLQYWDNMIKGVPVKKITKRGVVKGVDCLHSDTFIELFWNLYSFLFRKYCFMFIKDFGCTSKKQMLALIFPFRQKNYNILMS